MLRAVADREWSVLELRYVRGCSYDSIADLLQISVFQAHGLAARARDKARQWAEENPHWLDDFRLKA